MPEDKVDSEFKRIEMNDSESHVQTYRPGTSREVWLFPTLNHALKLLYFLT